MRFELTILNDLLLLNSRLSYTAFYTQRGAYFVCTKTRWNEVDHAFVLVARVCRTTPANTGRNEMRMCVCASESRTSVRRVFRMDDVTFSRLSLCAMVHPGKCRVYVCVRTKTDEREPLLCVKRSDNNVVCFLLSSRSLRLDDILRRIIWWHLSWRLVTVLFFFCFVLVAILIISFYFIQWMLRACFCFSLKN